MVRDIHRLSDKFSGQEAILFGESRVDLFVVLGRIVSFTKLKNALELEINDTTGAMKITFNKMPSEEFPSSFNDKDINLS